MASLLAVALPAVAKPAPRAHPDHGRARHTRTMRSNKCTATDSAYRASGMLMSWNASRTGRHTYTGTVTVRTRSASHTAASSKRSVASYTFTNAHVSFSHSPKRGDRVVLIGKITRFAGRCANHGAAGRVTIRKIDVTAAKR